MQKIRTDETQRETTVHGSVAFPVEINHDDLSGFENQYIRCHWHPEMEISIVCQGEAIYHLGSGTYTLQAGQGVFINTKIPHTVMPKSSQPVMLLTLIVHPSFLYGTPESIIATKLIQPLVTSGKLTAVLLEQKSLELFFQIERYNEEKPFAYELLIKGLFCEAFFSIFSSREEELKAFTTLPESDLKKLDSILQILHSEYEKPLNLRELSAELGISREGCCRFFKKITGQTLSQYLETYRIAQSLPLLKEGNLSVVQVAETVGFRNAGRFSAAFARQMECTPKKYCCKIQQTNHREFD